MKWILLIVVLAPLGHGETTRSYVAGESREYNNYSPQAANQVYYTQPANNQYQVSSSGYSGYGGYANYPGVQLKQESSNYGTDLLSFGDGNDNAGEDSLGAIGGTVGAIAAAVGLKVLKKLGAAAVFTFIFVIIPLLIVPVVLAIAAIIVSTVNNTGSQATDLMEKIRDKFGQKRALSIFENYLLNEQCIERMFCAIGRRAYERNFIFSRGKSISKEDSSDSTGDETTEKPQETKNVTFFSRVSRAFRSENCQAYKCSLTSYFY